jgi:hypothetical protein
MELVGFWVGVCSLFLAVLSAFPPARRRIEAIGDSFDAMNRERLGRRLVELRARLHDLELGTLSLRFHRNIAGGLLAVTVAFAMIFWGFVLHQGEIKGITSMVLFTFGVAICLFGSALNRVNVNGVEDLRGRIERLGKRVEIEPLAKV